MRYTKYFALINKDMGLQRISKAQLGRIMNFVFLEGELKGLHESSKLFKQDMSARGLELLKFNKSKRITILTGNMAPKALMEEIYYLSEKET